MSSQRPTLITTKGGLCHTSLPATYYVILAHAQYAHSHKEAPRPGNKCHSVDKYSPSRDFFPSRDPWGWQSTYQHIRIDTSLPTPMFSYVFSHALSINHLCFLTQPHGERYAIFPTAPRPGSGEYPLTSEFYTTEASRCESLAKWNLCVSYSTEMR
jgi:hypothetical protein